MPEEGVIEPSVRFLVRVEADEFVLESDTFPFSLSGYYFPRSTVL
jgi:hypothetical protein